SASGIGQALIFVLLTYGGWNEASYISADVNRKRKDIVKVLLYSIGLITFTYLIINLSLIRGLGLEGISSSNTVAADLVGKTFGQGWIILISVIISIAAISTVNAVMITGARTNYALGMDFRTFRFLSHLKRGFSLNAFLFQSAIALALVGFGSFARNGFVTMVEYTAPVFWLFFLLVGISLFVLRHKEANIYRPFLVPLYPLIPIIFCIAAAYMLYSSLAYTGSGAVTGVIVLCSGLLLLFIDKNK
ncbi:MAG: APC family permease, partial [Bacteroidota bacterium]|nr:APC family permease [Bacteroidota bacterium]